MERIRTLIGGRLAEPDTAAEGRPAELGFVAEGRPVEPGVVAEGCPSNPARPLKVAPLNLASSLKVASPNPTPPLKAALLNMASPFPDLIVPELRAHLDALTQSAGLVFPSPQGAPLRHSNFYRRVWLPALVAVGLSGIHFHDLRGTGNQLSADAGANLRELMERMGHDSTRAALIYLHSSAKRQRAIADQIGKNATTTLGRTPGQSGTYVARDQTGES
jgi:hypothetical protein